jgi:polyhydroxybutyrate depolymerase
MARWRLAALRRLVLGSVLIGWSSDAAFPPGTSVQSLDFGGVARSYRVRVPARYDGSVAVPLVLDIHGLSSNAAQQAALSGMGAVAEREGFIVVYPDGVRNAWNAGLCCGNREIDDVGFLRALVAAIAAEANIDATRVYATGLSNGGAMSQRLGCDAADLFAAVAPMAFPVPFEPLSGCQPSRAMPVLTFMGLTDVLVRYAGGLFPSAPDTFAYWRDIDGCGTGEPDERSDSGMSRCETYTRCTNGVKAGLCSITAASFGGSPFDGHILYINPDFKLAEVAWAFLSQFRLPPASPAVRAVLTGPATLRMSRKGRLTGTLQWTTTLGDGTWAAEDGSGNAFSGPARGRRGAKRQLRLGLTGDARASLLAALAPQLSQLAGAEVTMSVVTASRVTARVNGRAGRVTLTGRLLLSGAAAAGPTKARYVFHLKGAAGE